MTSKPMRWTWRGRAGGIETAVAALRDVSNDRTLLSHREGKLMKHLPTPARQAEWLAGRVTVKALAGELLGLGDHRIEVLYAEDGRPLLHCNPPGPRLHVSLSHDETHCAVALSDQPCGVDVESPSWPAPPRRDLIGSQREFDLLDAVLESQGSRFSYEAMLFSIKEAALKTKGHPLTIPAQQAQLAHAQPNRRSTGLRAEVSLGNDDHVMEVDVVLQRPEFILCVAHC